MSYHFETGKSISTSRATEAGLIGAVAQWCEALQSKAPLRSALDQLAHALNAEAVALTRAAVEPTGETRSLVYDRQSNRGKKDILERSFARNILGDYFHTCRDGTIWLRSMVDEVEPALEEFHRRRRMNELVVIPLSIDKKTVDFIELHFTDRLCAATHAQLNMIAATLANTWANRASGLFVEALMKRMQIAQSDMSSRLILSFDNPSRLSRAEYRLCVLLSRGLTAKAAEKELNICSSTARTHLRNIYQKTGTHSLSELVFSLLSDASGASDVRASYVA